MATTEKVGRSERVRLDIDAIRRNLLIALVSAEKGGNPAGIEEAFRLAEQGLVNCRNAVAAIWQDAKG